MMKQKAIEGNMPSMAFYLRVGRISLVGTLTIMQLPTASAFITPLAPLAQLAIQYFYMKKVATPNRYFLLPCDYFKNCVCHKSLAVNLMSV